MSTATTNGVAAPPKPARMEVDPENIPGELLELPRWLVWRFTFDPRGDGGRGKWTKTPICARTGRAGSSTDSAAWCDFQACYEAAESGEADGVGIALGECGDGRNLCGIDLDDVRDPETGKLSAEAELIIRKVGGYWEVSPSATGVKGLFWGEKPRGRNKAKLHAGEIEVYGSGRYFTVTGRVLPGCTRALVDANEALEWLQGTFLEPTPKPATTPSGDDSTRAVEMLDSLAAWRADSYADWVAAGMAVKSVDPELFPHWDRWSQRSDKYDAEIAREKWDSFNGSGLGIGSLYHWATQDGWKPTTTRVEAKTAPAPVLTFPELVAKFPAMKPPLIDGIVRLGETVNIIGDPKVGKSWLNYCILLSLCSGRPLFDRYSVHRGRVLLIDNELHGETLHHRLNAVAAAMGLVPLDWQHNLDIMPLRGDLRGIGDLAGQLGEMDPGKYVAIAIDARYRVCLGNDDENSNSYQAHFYNTVDQIAGRTGAAVLLVHHATKGSQAEKKVTDIGAGGGAQSRAADAHLVLRPHEDDGTFVLDGVVRSFPPLVPLGLRWEYPLWTAALDVDTTKLKGRLTGNQRRQQDQDREGLDVVLGKLREGPATITELVRRGIGMGKPRAEKLLGLLIDAGDVTRESGTVWGNQATIYQLTEGDE